MKFSVLFLTGAITALISLSANASMFCSSQKSKGCYLLVKLSMSSPLCYKFQSQKANCSSCLADIVSTTTNDGDLRSTSTQTTTTTTTSPSPYTWYTGDAENLSSSFVKAYKNSNGQWVHLCPAGQ